MALFTRRKKEEDELPVLKKSDLNQVVQAEQAVDAMTNELLKKNAEALKQGTIATAEASEKGIVVSLDLTITDELRDEGFARDIVRSIQDARRKMNCAITDRITLSVSGDYPQAWAEYICNETLSSLGEIAAPDTEYDIDYEDGRKAHISLKK